MSPAEEARWQVLVVARLLDDALAVVEEWHVDGRWPGGCPPHIVWAVQEAAALVLRRRALLDAIEREADS